MSESRRVVGTSLPRVDALEKVTGAARFTGDLAIPGLLHGKVLRSPFAHARIAHIDTAAAQRIHGVRAILTGADLAGPGAYYGHAIKDRPIVAIERVRFAGEPVAAVAADHPAAAEEALLAIQIEYTELAAATSIEAAMATSAPRLHEGPFVPGLFHGLGELRREEGNICYHYRFARGDIERTVAEADIVVEDTYTFPAVYQYAMEPHTAIAQWDSDGLTITACCQHPYLVRAELADVFGLPLSAVRIIVPYIGGGFGSKSYTKMEPLTAALARKAGGRPVRIANTVEEAMVTTRRHNMKCWMRTAASRDGVVKARQCRIWLDTGAYADNGPRVAATAGDAAPGPYRWRAVEVDAWAVYTNTPPAGSYRGFGAAHLGWIGELQIDLVARKAGIDPLEFRRRNLLRPGEEVRPGGKPLDADLAGDVTKVAEAIGWDSSKPARVGRGLSVGLLAAGAHPVSTSAIRLQADGTAVLLVSTTELGQGARTVLTQIASEALALAPQYIRVIGTDTQVTPYDRSTGASRSTTLAGTAVYHAAVDLRDQLVNVAAAVWGLPRASLEAHEGAVWHETERLSYSDLIKKHFGMAGGELIGHGEVRPVRGTGSYAEGPVFWEVCVAGAEVDVDPDTGRIHVRRLVSVADVGKAINPQLVEAQDEGACLQGLGNALFEEMFFEDGRLVNDSLLEYRIPKTSDLPDEFRSILVENADGPGPYGVKGVGEGALAAVPGALATALADLGVVMCELPLTPERVWRQMQDASCAEGRSR